MLKKICLERTRIFYWRKESSTHLCTSFRISTLVIWHIVLIIWLKSSSMTVFSSRLLGKKCMRFSLFSWIYISVISRTSNFREKFSINYWVLTMIWRSIVCSWIPIIKFILVSYTKATIITTSFSFKLYSKKLKIT
jgi:hypothetical protein